MSSCLIGTLVRSLVDFAPFGRGLKGWPASWNASYRASLSLSLDGHAVMLLCSALTSKYCAYTLLSVSGSFVHRAATHSDSLLDGEGSRVCCPLWLVRAPTCVTKHSPLCLLLLHHHHTTEQASHGWMDSTSRLQDHQKRGRTATSLWRRVRRGVVLEPSLPSSSRQSSWSFGRGRTLVCKVAA